VKVNVHEKDSVVIISVDSSVLQEHVPLVRERFNDIIADKKYWIVFDMLDANYISSMGISVILAAKRKANEQGGDVLFANVNHLIMNLFEVTELIKKLEVYDNVEDAVDAIKRRMP
jgi:anti-sigma B factor antagonist